MKKDLIKNYIDKIKKEDIINYLKKENIYANNDEINIIYNSIKNDSDIILNSNFMNYISNFKYNLNEKLYTKIIEKYNEYKKFIE